MFLKLAYLPSKLCLLGKYLFYEHQISAEQLSADSSSTEALYCIVFTCRKYLDGQYLSVKSAPTHFALSVFKVIPLK